MTDIYQVQFDPNILSVKEEELGLRSVTRIHGGISTRRMVGGLILCRAVRHKNGSIHALRVFSQMRKPYNNDMGD